MLKREELNDPKSCLNKARDNELIFVLLERDPDAPDTIRDWVGRRLRRGSNVPGDAKIKEALALASEMEAARITP